MYITIGNTNTARTITIHVGTLLDRSAYQTFIWVCRLTERSRIQSIIVDLNETTSIRSSGLGMLLTLRDEAESRGVEVQLGDCNPEIKYQINASRLLAGFPHADEAPRVCLTQKPGADQHPTIQG